MCSSWSNLCAFEVVRRTKQQQKFLVVATWRLGMMTQPILHPRICLPVGRALHILQQKGFTSLWSLPWTTWPRWREVMKVMKMMATPMRIKMRMLKVRRISERNPRSPEFQRKLTLRHCLQWKQLIVFDMPNWFLQVEAQKKESQKMNKDINGSLSQMCQVTLANHLCFPSLLA